MRERQACRWWFNESGCRLSGVGCRGFEVPDTRHPTADTPGELMKLRLVAAVAICAKSAFAQLKETVNVNVTEVPVTVVDSSGNPVRGLTAANFEVYDGGKKQAITSFDK